jgi:hypothetical protein
LFLGRQECAMTRLARSVAAALLATACSSDDTFQPADAGRDAPFETGRDAEPVDAGADRPELDAPAEAEAEAEAGCPSEMVQVESFCIDRFEAPNREGELPLVMYSFVESERWCSRRGKRLCFDDEWTRACAGPLETKYPYGEVHARGTCNDDETWRLYDQAKLNGWPLATSSVEIESLSELLSAAREVSSAGALAADHVEWLYQAEPAGANAGCVSTEGAFDTQGNVEEWTRRRDGGDGPDFSGNLKGRYWAEARTCQSGVKTHGNGFRFYEIGFRCCLDL